VIGCMISFLVAMSSSSSSSSKVIVCPDCALWFSTSSKYRYHRRTTHCHNIPKHEQDDVIDQCELIPAKFGQSTKAKCKLCSRVTLLKNIADHVRRHSYRFDCVECAKKFRSKRDLKSHQELHQSVQVVCPECGVGFKSTAVFRSHRSRKHASSTTNDNVSSSKQLTIRRDQQHTTTMMMIFCPVCQKRMHRNSLHKHLRRVHNDDDTNTLHMCTFCHKQLGSKETLKVHQQVHADQLNFSCPDCSRLFQTKRSLDWHRKQTGHFPTQPQPKRPSSPTFPPPVRIYEPMPSPLLADTTGSSPDYNIET